MKTFIFTPPNFHFPFIFIVLIFAVNTAFGQTLVLSDTVTVYSGSYNIHCHGGSDGGITIGVSGGVTPYTFIWSNSATTQNVTGLAAGTYSVTVSDSGGVHVDSIVGITISQPATLTASTAHSNVLCHGGITGSAWAIPSGGTTSYSYLWSNGGQTTDTAVALPALVTGPYMVTVTDANSCTATATATISEPSSALTDSISSHTNVSCYGGNNGSATVTASGGTSPYSYLWSGGGQTTASATSLVNSTYYVTVTDANSCTVTASTVITQPATLTASTAHSNVLCHGGSTGSAWAIPSGGTASYSYLWSNGGQTTDTAVALPALVTGPYIVTVTDANSCTTTATATISEPSSALADSISSHTNVSCYNGNSGAATVTAYGGTSPYTYLWNTSLHTTAAITSLVLGTYTVTVTDNNGCTTTVSTVITQPAALSASTGVRNILCAGGSTGYAWAIVSGGTTGYSYSWSNSQTTDTATGLSIPGTAYWVTVTDAKGCTKIAPATITKPFALVPFFSLGNVTDVSCHGGNDGRALVTVFGGITPYSYLWSNSETGQRDTILNNGVYYVTVTDSNACTATTSIIIHEPALLTVNLTDTKLHGYDIYCHGGTTTINTAFSGGTIPPTYLWSNSSTGNKLDSAAIGTYSITITDAHSCTATNTITLTQPTAIADSISSPLNGYGYNVSCMVNDGEIDLSASGGVTPYTYHWSNSISTQNNYSVSAGSYSVTITDYNGCTHTATKTLTIPAKLTSVTDTLYVYANGANVSEDTAHNGSITAYAFGGTSPYTYQWSTPNSFALPSPNTNQTLNNCYAYQIYYVMATDANACTLQSGPILLNSYVGKDFWSIHGNVIDTTRFIGTLDTTDFIVKTNNIERMRVKANGNVNIDSLTTGINVINKLVVNRITSTDTNGIAIGDSTLRIATNMAHIYNDETAVYYKGISIGKGSPGIYTVAMGANSMAIGNGVQTHINGTNSVVIGSCDPNSSNRLVNDAPNTLKIGFNSNIPTLYVGPSSGDNTTGNIGIGTTPSYSNPLLGKLDIRGDDNSSNHNVLHVADNSNNPLMVIRNDGNVGIGTTPTDSKLEVTGNIKASHSGNSIWMGHDGNNARLNNEGAGNLLINYTNAGKEVDINTGSGSSDGDVHLGGNNYLAVDGGKVGIGTSLPNEKLQIGDYLTLHSEDNSFIGYNFYNSNGDKRNVSGYASAIKFTSDGNIEFKTSSSGSANSSITWSPLFSINHEGYVCIGTTNYDANYILNVCGFIKTKAVNCETTWCDYVFDEKYNIMPLNELDDYINTNKHLPEIPTDNEIKKDGLDVGKTIQLQMKKIEELTLYVIELKREIEILKSKNK